PLATLSIKVGEVELRPDLCGLQVSRCTGALPLGKHVLHPFEQDLAVGIGDLQIAETRMNMRCQPDASPLVLVRLSSNDPLAVHEHFELVVTSPNTHVIPAVFLDFSRRPAQFQGYFPYLNADYRAVGPA